MQTLRRTRHKVRCSMVVYRSWMIPHLLADHHPIPPLHCQLPWSRLMSPSASTSPSLNSLQQRSAGRRTNILTQNHMPPFSKHTQTCSSSLILFLRTRRYQRRKHMARRKEKFHLASPSAGFTASKAWRTRWASCQHRAREAAPARHLRDTRAQASLVPSLILDTIFMLL